jgi:phenylpropionate dioxygenase-like ring-hydroxylating dioxygenase large terminal subunit
MKPNMSKDELLRALKTNAALPEELSEATPPQLYTSPEILELELNRIFNREWHCVGREDAFEEPGSFRTTKIGRDPVVIIKGRDGLLRAMSNVCRHRMATLVQESEGSLQSRMTCPYHAWSYGLDGQLMAATHMRDNFDKSSCRLPQFRVEVWFGWVYVNLDPEAEALAPRLSELTRLYGSYRVETYRSLFTAEEVWDTNWKVLIQNFMDLYHLFCVHAETVEHALPTHLTEALPGGDGYAVSEQTRVEGSSFEYDAEMTVSNPDIEERLKSIVPLICVFPTHLISISPERTFWLALQPQGTGQVKVFWGVDVYPGSFPEGEEGKRRKQQLRASFDHINDEDKGIIAGIYQNAGALAAEPGRLSPKEGSIVDFQRYLARMLCD